MTSDSIPNHPQTEIIHLEVDARGMRCPLPLLKAKQALNQLQSGEALKITATDAGSVRDFHAYAEISGHRILRFVEADGTYEYVLQKH